MLAIFFKNVSQTIHRKRTTPPSCISISYIVGWQTSILSNNKQRYILSIFPSDSSEVDQSEIQTDYLYRYQAATNTYRLRYLIEAAINPYYNPYKIPPDDISTEDNKNSSTCFEETLPRNIATHIRLVYTTTKQSFRCASLEDETRYNLQGEFSLEVQSCTFFGMIVVWLQLCCPKTPPTLHTKRSL